MDLDGVYRAEYPRCVATLTRLLGDIGLAEEAVQDAFAVAVQKWGDGLPPNPGGWIVTTARNRAIDRVRRESTREARHAQALLLHQPDEPAEVGPVRDDQLRMIFTCCHPALSPLAQTALTLRLLGGLAVAEIARAYPPRPYLGSDRRLRRGDHHRHERHRTNLPADETRAPDRPTREDLAMTEQPTMNQETVSATLTVATPIARVFAVLADPTTHAAIDGTGWIQEPIDRTPLTEVGQLFRMGMYHTGHPDGNYQTVNKVDVLEPPHAIGWRTGGYNGDGQLELGGWFWRYDLAPLGPSETEVTLTYDWSGVPENGRHRGIQFPPFGPDHLINSLRHLAELA